MLNYAGVSVLTPAEMSASARRVLRFIDLGGHEKYLKTALYGMTCMVSISAMCCIGASSFVKGGSMWRSACGKRGRCYSLLCTVITVAVMQMYYFLTSAYHSSFSVGLFCFICGIIISPSVHIMWGRCM